VPSVVFTPGSYAVPLNRPDVAPFGGGYDPVEPAVSVNRTDPGNVAISSQNWIQVSTNGGATFPAAARFYPPPEATEYFGDTTTAFDADGRLYWANLLQLGDLRHVYVTQVDPITAAPIGTLAFVPVPPGLPKDDKSFLAADTDLAGISPYRNNLYVAFSRLVPLAPTGQWRAFFARSTNQARSWTNVRQLSTDAEGLAWGYGEAMTSTKPRK
jgi:hypothetical protein